jgi:hypothetical protein
MDAVTALGSALGLSFASGISLYATAAFTGVAAHLGWIALPPALQPLGEPWVFGIAGALAVIEAAALLVPWVATGWETAHTAIRPLAAAGAGVLATWGSPRLAVAAGILGGLLGLATHTTKLGLRAAIDVSPEPFSNASATAGELSVVAVLAWAVWHHPWLALGGALLLLGALFLLVRKLWRLVVRSLRSLVAPPPA